MNRRRVIIAIAVAAVLTIGFFVWPSRTPPEPVYDGKTLSTWLTNYGSTVGTRLAARYSWPPLWDSADLAISTMGTNALPHLLHILKEHDTSMKLKLVALAQKQTLFKIDFVPATTRQEWAAQGFRALGTNAQPAVPELIKLYEHGRDRSSRLAAATALADAGEHARQAVPSLIHGATNTSEDPVIRFKSMIALQDIGADPAILVPALTQILREPPGRCSSMAIRMVEVLGPRARPAAPVLFEHLKIINNDPKKVADYNVVGNNLQDMNIILCRTIRVIDPEIAERRKSELDAHLKSGESK